MSRWFIDLLIVKVPFSDLNILMRMAQSLATSLAANWIWYFRVASDSVDERTSVDSNKRWRPWHVSASFVWISTVISNWHGSEMALSARHRSSDYITCFWLRKKVAYYQMLSRLDLERTQILSRGFSHEPEQNKTLKWHLIVKGCWTNPLGSVMIYYASSKFYVLAGWRNL